MKRRLSRQRQGPPPSQGDDDIQDDDLQNPSERAKLRRRKLQQQNEELPDAALTSGKTGKHKSFGKKERDTARATEDHSESIIGDDEEQQPQPVKKKRKNAPSEVKGRKKSSKKRSLNEEEKQKVLEEGKAEAKAEFESYRASVLEEIPQKYKDSFNQIGFSKWGKHMMAILVLSPFDIPPRPVREQWLEMFSKVRWDIVSTQTAA